MSVRRLRWCAPSLASAIELLTQAEYSARQRALLPETSGADKEVEQQRIEMEAGLIRKRGTEEILAAEKIAGVESENRRKQTKEQARAAKALADAELARKRQETDNEAARLTLEAQEKAAEAQLRTQAHQPVATLFATTGLKQEQWIMMHALPRVAPGRLVTSIPFIV
jgi:hypothetical protein